MLNTSKRMSILQERNRIYAILALCALFSSGLGILIFATENPIYLSLMRMSASRPVSIVGSLVAVIVPYFVSVLVVTNSKRALAYLLCSVRIFLVSAAYLAINLCFGSAGFLMGVMLLFPDIALIPMLITVSIRRLTGESGKWDALIGCIYTTVIALINYCTVSPCWRVSLLDLKQMGRYVIHVGLDRRL